MSPEALLHEIVSVQWCNQSLGVKEIVGQVAANPIIIIIIAIVHRL